MPYDPTKVRHVRHPSPKVRYRTAIHLSPVDLVQLINDPDEDIRNEVAQRVILSALPQLAYDESDRIRKTIAYRIKSKLTPVINQVLELPVEQWTFKERDFIPQICLLAKGLTADKTGALIGMTPTDKFLRMVDYEDWRFLLKIIGYIPVSHIIKLAKHPVTNIRIEVIRRVPVSYLSELIKFEQDELAIDFILERMPLEHVPPHLQKRYDEILVENVIDS